MTAAVFKKARSGIGKATPQEIQYATLNAYEALRSGDLKTSLDVLKDTSKRELFQIDFDAIETLDDVWEVENAIHNAVLRGLIPLPVAELALKRVAGIEEYISDNLRVERENIAYQEKLAAERAVFPGKLKEYEALNSFQKMQFEQRNPLFKKLYEDYGAKQKSKPEKNKVRAQ